MSQIETYINEFEEKSDDTYIANEMWFYYQNPDEFGKSENFPNVENMGQIEAHAMAHFYNGMTFTFLMLKEFDIDVS